MTTPAEMVVLIDAEIASRVSGGDVVRSSHENTSLQKSSLPELMSLRKYYHGLADQESAISRANLVEFEESE
jgi:hypothetical protein